MNNYDVNILPSEPRYWMMMAGALLMGVLFVSSFDKISDKTRNLNLRRLGFAMIAIHLFLPIYTLLNPDQTFSLHRSLPFHFCGVNFLLLALNCFLRNRKLFVYTFFMSILGGFYSLLTPLLTIGDAPFVLLHYIIVHTLLFVIPIVMVRVYGMRLKSMDWMRSYLFAAIISTIMIFINGFLNTYIESPDGVIANYMFVSAPPHVSNPFLFPSLGWPLYLVPVHFAILLHLLVLNMIYRAREINPITVAPSLWQ